jgi:hypothetical protein
MLCEGFLGISANFDLWRYLFAINLQKKREKGGKPDLHIQLWNNPVGKYPSMWLSTTNKGWHL